MGFIKQMGKYGVLSKAPLLFRTDVGRKTSTIMT